MCCSSAACALSWQTDLRLLREPAPGSPERRSCKLLAAGQSAIMDLAGLSSTDRLMQVPSALGSSTFISLHTSWKASQPPLLVGCRTWPVRTRLDTSSAWLTETLSQGCCRVIVMSCVVRIVDPRVQTAPSSRQYHLTKPSLLPLGSRPCLGLLRSKGQRAAWGRPMFGKGASGDQLVWPW